MATQVSSVVTTGAIVSATQLAELVQWGLNGFPHPVPVSVPGIIAAILLGASHGVYNLVQSRKGAAS